MVPLCPLLALGTAHPSSPTPGRSTARWQPCTLPSGPGDERNRKAVGSTVGSTCSAVFRGEAGGQIPGFLLCLHPLCR